MQKDSINHIAWRFYLVLAILALAVSGLVWRVFDLAILDQPFLRHQGDERTLRLVSTPAFRGMIMDRNGFPLAVSTLVYSVWMNPREFSPSKTSLTSLSRLLAIKPKMITQLAHQKKKKEFVYLKRSLSPQLADQIKALNIRGIYLQQDYRRYYPEGEVAAHVVGFTNVDDRGQEGLELGYNEWLAGEPGKKWVIKDRLGRVISDAQAVQAQKAGQDLMASIDRRIQYLAYRELLAGIMQHQAASGSVVVLDVMTGEVLAMVNYPSFNPNNRPDHLEDRIRNRAVTDIFEPGSTIKAFTVASAFETSRFKLDSVIDTSPGWMRVGRNIVRDKHNNKVLTMTQILQKSSNVGAAKIVLALPPDELWSLLHRVGFGEPTGIHFPGEQIGSLTKHEPWGAFILATLSFGYGLSSTPLQLARAYSVLASEGIKKPISLLRVNEVPPGERVMDASIAKQMLFLLESVISREGTAESAKVPGYRVAGKTGTTVKSGEGGYEKGRHISSFVGIAPLTNPKLVVAVVVDDPRGKLYYGGDVAGPIFEKIMEGTLRILDVPPDHLPAS